MTAGSPALPPVEELLALIDGLPASVALWDTDVRLRYGNRRSLTRFGRPAEQLLGAHLSDLVQAHAVELSRQYIDGALAGRWQQVERATVDPEGQRYNAHQVTHIPNRMDGRVIGYCALAIDVTATIEGYEQARRAREDAALRAERERIADDIGSQRVVDDLSAALERLDAAVERAADALPSLNTAADAIDRTIEELRATVPARMIKDPDRLPVAFPSMPEGFTGGAGERAAGDPDDAGAEGVPWPADITGGGWSAADACALLDLLPVGVAIWDFSFRNVFANRVAARWFGATDRSEVVGRFARDLVAEEAWTADAGLREALLRGDELQFERTVTHRGRLRHLQVSCTPRVRDGRVDGFYSFVVDVTARVEAELALQEARAELAAARERERIADDLHNLVIQRLFSAGLAAALPAPSVTDAQLRSVQDGIVGALADLETAVTTLHGSVGLLDVLPDLARLVHTTMQPHGIGVTIENVGSIDYVPPAVGAELLAVAEEALTNVAEHAQADTVVVTVAADASGLWLRVVDDGRGIDGDPHGKGTADMAARAARLGGTCTWRPNEPAGTIVDWRVPTPR